MAMHPPLKLAGLSGDKTMLKKFVFLMGSLFLAFLLSACTNSNSDTNKNRVGQLEDLGPCGNIITDVKINSFNQNSTQFQLKAAGYSRRCMSEVIVNGEPVQKEVAGHTAIIILPNLKFISVKSAEAVYILRLQVQAPTATEIEAIFSKLQVAENPASYLAFEKQMPAYLRFQSGFLYKITKATELDSELKIEFKSGAEHTEATLQSVNQLALGEKYVDVLWAPVNGLFSQLSVGPTLKTILWSQNDSISLLQTLAADMGGVSNPVVMRDIITFANLWNVNFVDLNNRIPEILPAAQSYWEAPVITALNANDMAFYLKYITRQDFNSPKKPIFDAFEKLEKFQSSTQEALQTALDYSQGLIWTPEQFSVLVETANILHPHFTKESWTWAKALAVKTNYDAQSTAMAAKAATAMSKRNYPVTTGNSELVFTKISAGLNDGNIDLYFQVFDAIRSTVKTTLEEADSACTVFVLPGRLTTENKSQYIELFNWLDDSWSFSFQESIQMLNIVSATQVLDANRTALFRRVHRWLSVNVAFSKAESFAKVDQYFNVLGLNDTLYGKLKAEHAALVQQGMPSLEALRNAEAKVFTARLNNP